MSIIDLQGGVGKIGVGVKVGLAHKELDAKAQGKYSCERPKFCVMEAEVVKQVEVVVDAEDVEAQGK